MLHHNRQLDCSIFCQCEPWSMLVVQSGLRSSSWFKLKLDDQDTFGIGICRLSTECTCMIIYVYMIYIYITDILQSVQDTHFCAHMVTFLSRGLRLYLIFDDMVRSDKIDTIQYDAIWHDMIWYDMVWWYGHGHMVFIKILRYHRHLPGYPVGV